MQNDWIEMCEREQATRIRDGTLLADEGAYSCCCSCRLALRYCTPCVAAVAMPSDYEEDEDESDEDGSEEDENEDDDEGDEDDDEDDSSEEDDEDEEEKDDQ